MQQPAKLSSLTRCEGSNPSSSANLFCAGGGMVDTRDLGSRLERGESSSLSRRTKFEVSESEGKWYTSGI